MSCLKKALQVIHLVIRIGFWIIIVCLIASIICPKLFNSLLFGLNLNLKYAQVITGIYIAYVIWLKNKNHEYKINIYENTVAKIQSTCHNLNEFYASMPLHTLSTFHQIDSQTQKAWLDGEKLYFEFKKMHDTNTKTLLEISDLLEAYEIIFRPYQASFKYLNEKTRKIISHDITGLLLHTPYKCLVTETQYITIENNIQNYNEHIDEVRLHISDLRIKVMNDVFSKIFNVTIPERLPLDKKYIPLETDYFAKESFLQNKYDWISRYLWWL